MSFAAFTRRIEGRELPKPKWDFTKLNGATPYGKDPYHKESILTSLERFITGGSDVYSAFVWSVTHQGSEYWEEKESYSFEQLPPQDQEYILAMRDYWKERQQ